MFPLSALAGRTCPECFGVVAAARGTWAGSRGRDGCGHGQGITSLLKLRVPSKAGTQLLGRVVALKTCSKSPIDSYLEGHLD